MTTVGTGAGWRTLQDRLLPSLSRGIRSEQLTTLAANLTTLVIALWQGWSLGALLWPYWIQSVAIGVGNVVRMALLPRSSTEGLDATGQPVALTAGKKFTAAAIFCVHYGLFHALYLLFIVILAKLQPGEDRAVLLGAVPLLIAQVHMTWRQVRADRLGAPNVETLVFLPYLRILPMHLTLILAPATLTYNSMLFQRLLMVLFGSLKTFAEHWSIRITADVDGPPVQTAPE